MAAMQVDGARILYASTNHGWSEGWTFYQMLASALAERSEVVYVDTPLSIARARGGDVGLARGARAGRTDGVHVLRSLTLPTQRSHRMRRAAARLLARQVARWSRGAGFQPDLVWTYTPYELELARRFPSAALVYWTGDEVTLPGEEELLGQADAVLCASQPVFEAHRERYGERVHFAAVACEFERYRAALDGPGDEEVERLPRPVAGYSGWLNERVDPGLLAAVAERLEGTLVLAGPVRDRAVAALERLPNVHLLGPQPAERVPRLIRSFDVALVPYRDTRFNRNSNPVKFYEYLAAARPVVTTDVPSLRRFGHVASVGAAETFAERVLAELDAPTGSGAERVEVARAHSFPALLDRLRAIPT